MFIYNRKYSGISSRVDRVGDDLKVIEKLWIVPNVD